ncbi:MAG TPA: exodeoxyribonuclease VII small subunit [Candidatus Saccharimonadales bacterium]|nr:exodeoxyribonuclease VII small subunit [Candidatus Saccharimonadales bacterium]
MTDTVDYRALSTELEELLAKLQSGDLTIDEAVPAYERGLKLVKELEAYLKTAENTVKKLTPKRSE